MQIASQGEVKRKLRLSDYADANVAPNPNNSADTASGIALLALLGAMIGSAALAFRRRRARFVGYVAGFILTGELVVALMHVERGEAWVIALAAMYVIDSMTHTKGNPEHP